MSKIFTHTLRVYYEDTDMAGIVYYANYLRFIERGRSDWVRDIGMDQNRMKDDFGIVFAVKRIEADYIAPARLDDVLVVYGQNGEPLRPAQGYPLRLLVPGWEGNTNVKWLRRLEVLDTPAMTREETSKYTEPMLDGSIRQFSFDIEARSIITSPSYPGTIEPGWQTISGLAWSGKGKIRRVEISTDGVDTW